MERATGGELLPMLARRYACHGVPGSVLARCFYQVVKAVLYLHGGVGAGKAAIVRCHPLSPIPRHAVSKRAGRCRRILHRDIKPENILVRGEDPSEVVICDLGACSIEGVVDPNEHAVRPIATWYASACASFLVQARSSLVRVSTAPLRLLGMLGTSG